MEADSCAPPPRSRCRNYRTIRCCRPTPAAYTSAFYVSNVRHCCIALRRVRCTTLPCSASVLQSQLSCGRFPAALERQVCRARGVRRWTCTNDVRNSLRCARSPVTRGSHHLRWSCGTFATRVVPPSHLSSARARAPLPCRSRVSGWRGFSRHSDFTVAAHRSQPMRTPTHAHPRDAIWCAAVSRRVSCVGG